MTQIRMTNHDRVWPLGEELVTTTSLYRVTLLVLNVLKCACKMDRLIIAKGDS